ncbi:DUF2218 domain-containing protein [Streptomyces fructofermentans]|uniref:DUF2218 domain-containing protein n=1 Tax=Streptomyces fructofermentans TaxID=152141 RepID=UPI0033C423A0
MPSAVAHIPAVRPHRYPALLAWYFRLAGGPLRHVAGLHGAGAARPRIARVEKSGSEVVIRLDRGLCTLHAGPEALVVHVEGVDHDDLRLIKELVGARLRKSGTRDALQIVWRPVEGAHLPDLFRSPAASAPVRQTSSTRRRRATIILASAVVAVVVIHLGLGLLLMTGPWKHLVVGVVLVAVLLHVVGGLAVWRRKRRAVG